MRRTAGIVASLIVIVAFLAGIAIGRMSDETSPRTQVVTSANTIPPMATMEVARPSHGILSLLMSGGTPEQLITSSPVSATPQNPPEAGIPDSAGTPVTSPIDTLKP